MSEKSYKNAVLVDFDVSAKWDFLQALEIASEDTWTVYRGISNRNHGNRIQRLIRYVKYFIIPLKIFFIRMQFKKIIAWQQFYGLILAFYFRIFKVKKVPKITVMTFIYKPKKTLIIGKLYERFMRYIVSSSYIERFIVFSDSERLYYSDVFGVNPEKFTVLKLGIEDVREKYPCSVVNERYFLSAGRSNRDYKFLCNAWETIGEREDFHLKIICDTLHKKNTEFITYLDNCHGEEYLKELSECYAVILPLDDVNISSGQLVMLQAMMLGKPIIVTCNNTVPDYIADEVTGLIVEKSVDELIEAINKLKNKKIYTLLSQNARSSFENNFSLYSMGMQIGKILKDD